MKRFFLHIMLLAVATVAMADPVGTWKLYPSYSNITEVQYSKADSSEVFVLANGNLFAYYKNDDPHFSRFMIEGATGVDPISYGEKSSVTYGILSDRDISHIAWCATVKKLVIVYSDGMIDLLNPKDRSNPAVGSIVGLKETTLFNDKTVSSLYVKGQYAYLQTSAHIIEIDVKDEYIVQTYNTTDISSMDGVTSDNLVEPVALNYKYGSEMVPDGPKSPEHNYIKLDNGKILTLRGLFDPSSDTTTPGDVQVYDIASNTWSTFDNSYAVENNKNCIAHLQLDVDPRDNNHIMVASKSGLYEYKNGKMVSYHDKDTDDPIISVIGLTDYSIVTGIKYDTSGNLWIFNMGNTNLLCLTSSGQWQSFKQNEFTESGGQRFKYPMIDSHGLLWFVNEWWTANDVKLGVYKMSTDQMRMSTYFVNEDETECFASKAFYALTEDLENNIWVGTDMGPFYLTPSQVETMCTATDITRIHVTQPKINREDGSGLADYLLSGVSIRDIKIDAANRKWLATTNGLYVISSDCNTEEAHFTTENSPIPVNTIKSIALDKSSGIVYLGTENGFCTYQSDITETYGDFDENNVYVYPNPVTPEYTGNITIMGLTNGCTVKIVNAAGHLVHTGICNGASYTWSGHDSTGNRVASGIYMVLVSNSEGDDGCVTKIAIVK